MRSRPILQKAVDASVFALALLAIVLGFVFLDQWLADSFAVPSLEIFRLRMRSITNVALAEYWFGVAILTYLLARLVLPESLRAENLRRWAVHLFCALLVSGALLHMIKFAVGRERPHVTPGHLPLEFRPFNFDWYWQSFPSGHSQVLFTAAACFVLLFPRQKIWIYVLALALASTRMIIIQHFFSDVIGGALVGFLGAQISFSLLAKKVPLPKSFDSRPDSE